ncbi:hypothetical protein, partial [Streptococcus pneumoniae]|uniref:hypothetical protein n=1 Tax=Streptococcus pneumoniae TaxID=1313 RepID=UPI0018B0B28C
LDTDQIESEVTWDGNVSFTSPTNITAEEKYRHVADTTFQIKGWVFRDEPAPSAPIYVVNTNFKSVATTFDYYTSED